VSWPPDEELLAAWGRLADEPTAGGAFVALTLPQLVRQLTAWRPTADPHAVESVAADVLLWLVKNPARYDPARSPLPAFLLLVARRKLLTELASERRHQVGKIPWDDVEFVLADRNEEVDDDSPSFDHPELQAVIATLSETDRRLLDLMRDGERSSIAFAAVMKIADRPIEEQEREVKRAKDRIKARFKRAVGGGNG
jgi:RNA polymerase sigma-70 factor (ECF subfamily)